MTVARLAEKLRKQALSYPETYEESPWGDRVVKVRGKIFAFAGARDGDLHISLKLPQSRRRALAEPWAKPTPYGLGKAGWVSMTFKAGRGVPLERIIGWIDESYRSIAPKRLAAQIASPKTARKLAPAKKLAARVALLCHDTLRAQRALRELVARGVRVQKIETAAALRRRLGKLDAVILDLGRHSDEGLALAGEIDASDHEIHLFLAGIRDAATRKRAGDLATSAELFKLPPGDPTVADGILTTLRRYSS
jgi:predicted DNA-binding protein (MmcQ/YjbR family)